MQDKEESVVDEAEEALTVGKADPPSSDKSTRDGQFAFRKMKTAKPKNNKKEKADKNSLAKYEGDGVVFKAKLIGLESVPEARGDKMCQEAMQRLKLNVKSTGPHKRKISISVSLQGIKIKDEKSGALIHHHPVSLISFISQDITDARAFGYVFGSTTEPHQFIAIKTEKPAFHVVLALRDLFQTVLNRKQGEIQTVKETGETKKIENKEYADTPKFVNATFEDLKPKQENIYVEVLLTEPFKEPEIPEAKEEPVTAVENLVDLESELTKLQEGINQMDTSIAAAVAFNSEIPLPENDPFDTSFVLGPKRDSFPMPIPTPFPATTAAANDNSQLYDLSGDKYAVFNTLDGSPSIFETPELSTDPIVADIKELEEEIARKTVPPKPPRLSKSASPDLSLFADLDPLGKDRPYKDKTEFFQDVKNPPKKVLNDLVDPSKETGKVFDVNLLSSSVPFPVDFETPMLSSTTPPSNFSAPKLQLILNGKAAHNPFENHNGTSPSPPNALQQQLTVNCNFSSSPIPIPSKHVGLIKDRAFSTDSIGSPYSKSPQMYNAESPNSYNSEGCSPKNGHYMNGNENRLASPNNLTKNNLNFLNSTTQNGVSRPRPRSTLNKGGSIPGGVRTHSLSSHSLSSDSSSDYEAISRENMQIITNNLLTNGHRLRAQSLCLESNNEFRMKKTSEKNIFVKKDDPFAGDKFFAMAKKQLTSAEIPEYV